MRPPSVPDRPHLRHKQSRRILEAARDLFINEGPAHFSARRVARVAQLSLGSVQHVFPTTEELLSATLAHVRDGYEDAYRQMAERLPLRPQERLVATVDYLLADICRPEQRRFWFGFYALSGHSEHAQSLLRDAYEHHVQNIAKFIGAARPSYPKQKCLDAAVHVIAIIDGMMIFTAIARRKVSLKSPIIKSVRRAILDTLLDVEPGGRLRDKA